MSLLSELSLSPPLILFEAAFDRESDAVWTLEDVHDLTDDAGDTYYTFFWWVSDRPIPDVEAALDADPTVGVARRVCDHDDRALFRVETTSFPADQPLVFSTLRAHDATTDGATRDADGLHLRARFPSRDALDGFVEAAGDIAGGVEVHRLYAEDGGGAVGRELTDRQRDALELAFERGYYETPSQVTLDALADEVGVTPQTLSRHLRVAVEKVVADAVAPTTPPLQDASQ